MNIYSSTYKLQNDITMLEKANLRNIHHVFICLLYCQFSCYRSEILTYYIPKAIFRESKAILNLNNLEHPVH